jgi:hypothetical protein
MPQPVTQAHSIIFDLLRMSATSANPPIPGELMRRGERRNEPGAEVVL